MRRLLTITTSLLLVAAVSACDGPPTHLDEPAPELQQLDGPAAASHSENAAPRSEGTFSSTAWADDHLWRWQRSQPVFNQGEGNDKLVFITPSDDNAQRPFYVVGWKAGGDGKQSTLFFDDPSTTEREGHDHVTTAPGGSDGTYKATVQLFVVVPADGVDEEDVAATDALNFFTLEPIQLAYAADLDDDGVIEPDEEFTNVANVQEAWMDGLVDVMTTFEETVLPMRDVDDPFESD